MPRRPKSSSNKNKRPRPLKRSDASLEKWNTLSDIPLDEEDQFHASRDKILLDGGSVDEHLEEYDEVFALKGLDEDDSEELAEQGDEEELGEAHEPPKKKSSKSKDKKLTKKKSKVVSSSSEESSEEESWGRNASAYYSSNAAQIESDDEEAIALEESEALRLQKISRDGMNDTDFGLNDPRDESNTIDDFNLMVSVPVVQPIFPEDKKSLLRLLEKNNPEALALASDWDDSAQNLSRTRLKLEKLQSENPDALSLSMVHLHHQTLLTYMTTLAFYLYLRASERHAQKPETLRTHPIMARLLTLKQGLTTLEDLGFALSDSEVESDEDEEDEDIDMDLGLELDGFQITKNLRDRYGLDPHELSELIKEAFSDPGQLTNERHAETSPKPPKKKRKISNDSSAPPKPIFDLVEPDFKPTKATKNPSKDDVSDVFGEALSLQYADAVDKGARRKSLQFHTAKIESASAKRRGARQALGGDDDIPYRDRRQRKEVPVKKQVVAGLDGAEPDSIPNHQDQDDESKDEADLDGYYNLVKAASKRRKEKKKEDYESMKASLRSNSEAETTDGPRSLTKTILTNRGLTPHRPKSARNPRVKKREKFEKAKKRVSSQKAMYKGGLAESGGRYDGEKSGISKVVKSVRLG